MRTHGDPALPGAAWQAFGATTQLAEALVVARTPLARAGATSAAGLPTTATDSAYGADAHAVKSIHWVKIHRNSTSRRQEVSALLTTTQSRGATRRACMHMAHAVTKTFQADLHALH